MVFRLNGREDPSEKKEPGPPFISVHILRGKAYPRVVTNPSPETAIPFHLRPHMLNTRSCVCF